MFEVYKFYIGNLTDHELDMLFHDGSFHTHIMKMEIMLRTGDLLTTCAIGTSPDNFRDDYEALKSILINTMMDMENEI